MGGAFFFVFVCVGVFNVSCVLLCCLVLFVFVVCSWLSSRIVGLVFVVVGVFLRLWFICVCYGCVSLVFVCCCVRVLFVCLCVRVCSCLFLGSFDTFCCFLLLCVLAFCVLLFQMFCVCYSVLVFLI